jgi:hypothetical protein
MMVEQYVESLGIDWLDIAIRAGKTFVQSFLAALVIPAGGELFQLATWKAPVLAAGAAAISAVWNIVVAEIKLRRG